MHSFFSTSKPEPEPKLTLASLTTLGRQKNFSYSLYNNIMMYKNASSNKFFSGTREENISKSEFEIDSELSVAGSDVGEIQQRYQHITGARTSRRSQTSEPSEDSQMLDHFNTKLSLIMDHETPLRTRHNPPESSQKVKKGMKRKPARTAREKPPDVGQRLTPRASEQSNSSNNQVQSSTGGWKLAP